MARCSTRCLRSPFARRSWWFPQCPYLRPRLLVGWTLAVAALCAALAAVVRDPVAAPSVARNVAPFQFWLALTGTISVRLPTSVATAYARGL